MSILDILIGLAYSLGGFIIGFALGRWTSDLHAIRETVCDDLEEYPDEPPSSDHG